MDVGLVTVGDELLAGDTVTRPRLSASSVNTNANWLASELDDRGDAVIVTAGPAGPGRRDDGGGRRRVRPRTGRDRSDARARRAPSRSDPGRVPEDAGDLDVDVDAAADWLLDTIDASRTPVSRDW